MSMELKPREHYVLQYYEFKTEDEVDADEFYNEQGKYEDWLNGYRKIHYKLVNIVRHPDMSRNVLIHYFIL